MADLPAPASSVVSDLVMLKLAREIAMDIRPVEEILRAHSVSDASWETISGSARFREYLSSMIAEWESASNTSERVKLKSMAFVEEALPEFFARAHDKSEALPAKTEILKTVARLAGFGAPGDTASMGDRLSVTINLGADKQLRIERSSIPAIIEGTANDADRL